MPKKKKIIKSPLTKTKTKPKKMSSKKQAAKPAAPPVITHEMIVKRAHEIWLKKNRSHHTNNALQNWLEAEAELRGKSGK